MDMIKRSPHRAVQVEEFTLSFCFEDGFIKRNFCNMFHNVRIVDLDCGFDRDRSPNYSEPVEATHTSSKVQHITDEGLCEYASQMMTSNLCGQLHTLDLDFKNLRISCQTILPQIKNMPVLEELTLSKPYLSVVDMELLHNNIPSIRKLDMTEMILQDSKMPTVAKPATPLTTIHFGIELVDNLEAHTNWYRYATKKYTNATRWDYYDEELDEMEDSQYIYENGYLDFLGLVAPTQSELMLGNLPENINVFDVLDGRDCRIIELYLHNCQSETSFQNLAQSKWSKYIKDLTVHDTKLGSFHHFQNFTMLTKLNLNNIFLGNSDRINLTDCLNSLPATLKELNIRCDDLKGNPINCRMNSIEKLDIFSRCITRNIVDIALTCFPKLVYLFFYGDINSSLNVVLHSQYLKSVQFRSLLPIQIFSYKSPSQPNPLLYTFEDGKKICVRYEDVETKPILSVISFTERTWEFSRRSVKLSQED
jgi:hypothetical protein